ncbi:MAG: hypothetical protein K6A93_02245 [Bacteroidaceae bacterium]|jgi:hypothetical protein|nr:hypothetical protein [Bacteroidaceae bacterium]
MKTSEYVTIQMRRLAASKWTCALFIKLFIFPCFAFQCSGQAAINKDAKYDEGDETVENPSQTLPEEDECHIDSVMWSRDGLSVFYKDEQDTCTYRITSEAEEQLMSAYVYSKDVQICCHTVQDEFIKSLDLLSKDQINAFLIDPEHRLPILLRLLIDKEGMAKQIRVYFLRSSGRCVSDSYIRKLITKIKNVRFPTTKYSGIGFCFVDVPVRESDLRDYIKNRFGE